MSNTPEQGCPSKCNSDARNGTCPAKPPGRSGIEKLVEQFDRNIHAYKSPQYNETELRVEFVNPFWSALGWDMENKAGYAMAYRDVIHEDAVKVGTATKAPDYCFRIGGARKFFLETKRPARDLKADPAPAYQLRRYGWSAKLPLSVLTDFEELIVYDCRLRPLKTDKASQARILYIHFKDYLPKWQELNDIFSREAVLKGSFDRYVESAGGKRGAAEVDAEFLKEIEGWRDALARNLALRNPRLTDRELNFAVQMTIDRIIFLRMCEDRGIEKYGQLQALCGGPRIYQRLVGIYQKADERYNSGLFHFQPEKDRDSLPDALTPKLTVDDKALKEIFQRLYYPDSPYEFRILPPEILGNVYEQFLGKVIRLTTGHQAKIEEKPEVRKAGGVYYTPSYIVDYIVKNTVGKLLGEDSEQKATKETKEEVRMKLTPAEASRFRVLDPACGSGSFLLGAYQYLLDWYLKTYLAEKEKTGKIPTMPPEAGQRRRKSSMPVMYQGQGGDYLLTTVEKKRILLNNIYGVDIDQQAVEVTKLSLLLKVLENENQDSLNSQLTLWRERALPDLSGNIKCGNSLIGPDFNQNRQLTLLDEEDKYRINAFDWNDDRNGFGQIMKSGGFDAVIGNPPYLNVDDTWGKKDARLQILKQQYSEIYNDKTDILFYFLAKGVRLSKGYVAFIVSRAFLEAYKANKLRLYIAKNTSVGEIVDFQNYHVFPGVGITTCIVTLQPGEMSPGMMVYKLRMEVLPTFDLSRLIADETVFETIAFSQDKLSDAAWVFVPSSKKTLHDKIDQAGEPLGKILIVGQGMQSGANEVFAAKTKSEISQFGLKPSMVFKRASNSDIQRYSIRDRGEYILYLEDVDSFDQLPKTIQHVLITKQDQLKNRAAYKRGNCQWWKYTWPLHKEFYSRKRILCPYLARFNRFAIDQDNDFLSLTDTTVLFENEQAEDLLYLLGLLNSRLLTFRFQSIGKLKSGGIIEYFWNGISKLPIRRINFSNKPDVEKHEQMVTLVESMLELHKKIQTANTPDEKTRLERQISATDREIDRLVYELYGLTEEEIKIVEGSA